MELALKKKKVSPSIIIYEQGTAQLQNIESVTKTGFVSYILSANSFYIYTTDSVGGRVRITINPQKNKTIHIVGSKRDTTGEVAAVVEDTAGTYISPVYTIQTDTGSFDLEGYTSFAERETIALVFMARGEITITGITLEP